jgi:hypothetical protein
MNTYEGVEVKFHEFLTSALEKGEWSASLPGERAPGTHCIGGWVGHIANLDIAEKIKLRFTLQRIERWLPYGPRNSLVIVSYPSC